MSNIKLKIESAAWQKIVAFTDLATGEISGLGKVVKREEELVVTDVQIFEQETSGAHSNISTEALAKFQEERVRAGESMREWCFWWHSHAHMGVFFSGTDTGTIDSSTEFPYLVSLVTNKKHEVKARLDLREPVRIYAEMDVEILETANEAVKASCQAEIDLKVKRPTYSGYSGAGYYGKFGKQKKIWEEEPADKAWYTQEEKMEYFAHRYYLKEEIETLLGVQHPSKKQERRLVSLREQLTKHIEWGRAAGMEPSTTSQELLPSLRDLDRDIY